MAPVGHRHVRSGWCGVDCPSCSPGWGKYRLGFEISSGRCNCWICGRTDPVKAIASLCRLPLPAATKLWLALPRTRTLPQPVSHSGHLVLPPHGDLLPIHRLYLQNRGFDADEISSMWGVRGIGMGSRLSWRLLIPIHDIYGRVVSWTTRAVSDAAKTRYISASPAEEEVPHKSILYGAHLARHSIVICEGPIDVWAIGPGAVATCGVGFSDAQMIAMSRFVNRAVCFDDEPAAQARAEKLCRQLAVMPGITENIVLETGKDPPECDSVEIMAIRNRYLVGA